MLLTSLVSFESPTFAHAPDYSLTLSSKADELTLTAQAPDGHHFNLKAPASATAPDRAVQNPALKTAQRVTFDFKSAKPGLYITQLYLCDDALTYCEKVLEKIQWGAPQVNASKSPSAPKNGSTGEVDAALKQARREHKLVMIDFFGVWCPPCNLLDEKVFSSPDFTKATQNTIRLKLDVDKPENWAYLSRYKVSGYPTVLFLNPEGQEISRVLGYRPLPQFLKTVMDASSFKTSASLIELREKANQGERDALDRLGLLELGSGDYASAVSHLSGTRQHREKLWDAKISLDAQELAQKIKDGNSAAGARLMTERKQAIAEFPNSPDSIDRRTELAAQLEEAGKKEEAKVVYLNAIQAAQEIITHHPDVIANYDSSVADLRASMAENYEAMGDSASALKTWGLAAADFRKELISPNDRGVNLELAYCLWKSGDETSAQEIYTRMEKAYPLDFTFFNNHARMKLALKKPLEAEPLAVRAVSLSYGSNRLEASLVLAKILKEQNKIKEARTVIDQATTPSPQVEALTHSQPIEKDQNVRYFRILKKLQDYKAKELTLAQDSTLDAPTTLTACR
jgi:tetratricopeptide (TPR) repeat protein